MTDIEQSGLPMPGYVGYPQARLRVEVEYRPAVDGQHPELQRIDIEVNHESVSHDLVAGIVRLLRDQETPPAPRPLSTGSTWPPSTFGSTDTTVFAAVNDYGREDR